MPRFRLGIAKSTEDESMKECPLRTCCNVKHGALS